MEQRWGVLKLRLQTGAVTVPDTPDRDSTSARTRNMATPPAMATPRPKSCAAAVSFLGILFPAIAPMTGRGPDPYAIGARA